MNAETNIRVRSPAVVDLFCGAGGLSYGMKLAGLDIVAGIDIDSACRHPFEANVGSEFYEMDVSQISSEWLTSLYPRDSLRILAGCAPCQPFSSYSRRRVEQGDNWRLLSKFSLLIREVQPDVVTMENVPRLTSHPNFDDFLNALEKAKYKRSYGIIRCVRYGVPQTRRRLVLMASRLGDIQMVPPTHAPPEFMTVKDSIYDLPGIEAGTSSPSDPLHISSGLSEKNLKRIAHSKQGGSWRDWPAGLRANCHTKQTGKSYPSVYGRMSWNLPGPTITTQFHGFGNGRFGHPVQNRAISLREGALLQTFPQDYSFVPESDNIHISRVARLIGNAVPVKLGEAIGRSIIEHLEESTDAPRG